MINIKKILFVIACALCLVSCKKFLAEYSQTDVIPKSTADFGEILFADGYPSASGDALQPWMWFLNDDIECYYGPSLAGDMSYALQPSAVFQWQPDFDTKAVSAGIITNTWFNYYQRLLAANVAIQYMDQSTGAQALKDQYKGEAYALRAFYHFMLVNIYAKPYNDSTTTPEQSPGIPIRNTADLTDRPLPRNTVKEVYNQITNDIDSAVYLLDKNKATTTPYRISNVAAHLIASRVYLYMGNWDKAIAHADQVLASHPQLMNLNTWGDPDPTGKPMFGSNNIESVFTYGTFSDYTPMTNNLAYGISHDLAQTFDPSDLRLSIGILIVPDFLKEWIPSDYVFQKVNADASATGVFVGYSWRSAEAYLNRAEAYIQKYKLSGDAGAATQALKSLNTLRKNRIDQGSFTPWVTGPAGDLLRMCREERRREFFMEEEHRWMDLRRYGMPAIQHTYRPDAVTTQVYRLKAHDPMYIMPIPANVLNRNQALVQNPLFNGTRMPE